MLEIGIFNVTCYSPTRLFKIPLGLNYIQPNRVNIKELQPRCFIFIKCRKSWRE